MQVDGGLDTELCSPIDCAYEIWVCAGNVRFPIEDVDNIPVSYWLLALGPSVLKANDRGKNILSAQRSSQLAQFLQSHPS